MSNLTPSQNRGEHFPEDSALLEELEASLTRLEAFASQAWAENTRRAYAADWEHFSSWCERHERSALPATADTVGLYLGAIVDDYSLATLERRLATVSSVHKEHDHESPASVSKGPLRRIWRGIVRQKTRQQDKAAPLLVEDLRRIIEHLPREESGELTLSAYRDRALLLTGWTGALRRSELVAIEVEHLEFVPGRGINLFIPRSKTDQAGEGLVKGIPYGSSAETCPVTALRTWLQVAEIESGPVFRRFYRGGSIGKKAISAQYVSLILKEHAQRVGLTSDDLSAHSLRSGFITQAIRAGKPERRVKEHSGHKSWETFNGYVKQASTFEGNPAEDIGL